MGTDIHMHVEYKDRDGKWECGDYFRLKNDRYWVVEFLGDRNYDLFAVLANVRNYGNTEYIDDPRGLPDDASELVREFYENWEDDAHSCSFLTLRELIDFNSEGHPLKRSGMISPEAQKQLDLGIIPDSWCQDTNVEGWERREWEEDNDVLVRLIEKLKERADDLNLIYYFRWDSENQKTRDLAYDNSSNIRIVFWFDN